MPYRHAHWWVLALIALTMFAFWSGYLSQLKKAPLEFHLHGATAFLWMVLVALQSWSIHGKHRDLHRDVGLASLGLFPFFLASNLLISVGMAKRFVEQESPFHAEYGPRLAPLDVVSVLGIAYFFYMALRWRRKVHLHARYMLATLVFLINPIVGRALTNAPPLQINGPEQLYLFAEAVRIGNAAIILMLLVLYNSSRSHGRVYLEAGTLVAIQMLLFETVGTWSSWEQTYPVLAAANPYIFALPGLIIGFVVVATGWRNGKMQRQKSWVAA